MARHPTSSLRASDVDRDAVAERLRQAAVEGRLEPEELEERLHAALRARTYGDLSRVLTDLPATRARHRAAVMPVALTVATRVLVTVVVAVVVLVVAALIAAGWVLWALVWLAFWAARRCSTGRLGASCAWRRTSSARRVQPGRPAGLR